MKVNKTITLDIEIVEKLMKEPNASAIVNQQLVNYYAGKDMTKWTREQLKAFIAEGELKQKHAKELEALKHG